MNLYIDIFIGIWIIDNWTEISRQKEEFKAENTET